MNNKQHSHNILLLGYGYVAQHFYRDCNLEEFNIAASINNAKNNYFETEKNPQNINFAEIDERTLDSYDNFVISIPPFYNLKTDAVIDCFFKYFLNRKTSYKLIYLSATSVYGNHEGKKVKENSELRASRGKGIDRIACENKYLKLQRNKCSNVVILRLAAIYGDKRNSILGILHKKITENKPSKRLISRTHVFDIVNIIKEVILREKLQNNILNIADNSPRKTAEVNDFICEELLKIKLLPESKISKETTFADDKIVDNSLLQETLNYQFRFPSYKEGLIEISKTLELN